MNPKYSVIFFDHCYNLTLKTISMINWISKQCLVNDYVVKADDIVVNTERLSKGIAKNEFKSGISGLLEIRVVNGISHRVYTLSIHTLPILVVPYVMSTDIIERLSMFATNGSIVPVLRLEDICDWFCGTKGWY